MADVDYQQPQWQTPEGNEGTVLAGIIQRGRQQQMEKARLGMEQQQFQRQVAGEGSIKDIAAKAAAKSAAQARLQKYLTPATEGGYGYSMQQLAATDPATILAAGMALPQQQRLMEVRPNAGIFDPNSGQFKMPPAAPAFTPQSMTLPGVPGQMVSESPNHYHYVPPEKPEKPSATFSDDTDTLPSGETLYGQRNSLTKEFKPFSSFGQEGGSVLERAARAAKEKAAEGLKRQASKDKAMLEKKLDDPLALKTIADALIKANPKLDAHDAMEMAEKQVQDQIDAKDEILQGAEARTAAPKTVRVKSPDGKAGSIPADQLDAAKSQGYTEIK